MDSIIQLTKPSINQGQLSLGFSKCERWSARSVTTCKTNYGLDTRGWVIAMHSSPDEHVIPYLGDNSPVLWQITSDIIYFEVY